MKNHAVYKDFHNHFCEDIDIINILSKLKNIERMVLI